MERYELPDGWDWVELGELLLFVGSGVTPKGGQKIYKTSGIPFIRSQNVYPDGLRLNEIVYISEQMHNSMARTHVKPTDVLLNITGASIGRSTVVPQAFGQANVNQHVCIIRPVPEVDPWYLSQFLNSPIGQDQIMESQSGVTRQGLNYSQLRKIFFPLAPLAVQQYLVTKIESLFEQSRTARTALTHVPVLMAQFRRAVLASAFRGELVEPDPNDETAVSLLEHIHKAREQSPKKPIESVDTSDLPELPIGWVWVRFEELLSELKNGHFSKAPAFDPPGIPILRISAVRPLSVKLDEPRFFRGDFDDVLQYKLRNGDLLFTRYNGSLNLVGICGMVRSLNNVMIYPDKLIRARFFENTVSPAYLEYYFASALPRNIIEDKAKSSAGQQGISGKDLKDVPVPLPPLGEQQRIVAKIEAMFVQADIIDQAASVSLRRAEQVDQSILARAFRGELG